MLTKYYALSLNKQTNKPLKGIVWTKFEQYSRYKYGRKQSTLCLQEKKNIAKCTNLNQKKWGFLKAPPYIFQDISERKSLAESFAPVNLQK